MSTSSNCTKFCSECGIKVVHDTEQTLDNSDNTLVESDVSVSKMEWKGPFGAIHRIRPDFWKQNQERMTREWSIKGPHSPIYDTYQVDSIGIPKSMSKIHHSLIKEFLSDVNLSRGDAHVSILDLEKFRDKNGAIFYPL